MYPNETALSNTLTAQAGQGMTAGLSDWERDLYRSEANANLGTNVGSPIGADYVGRNLLQATQQRQDYYRNMGMSIAGKQPVYQAQQPNTPNYTAGFTPNAVMGYNSQNYSPFASMYGNMYSANAGLQGNVNTNQTSLWTSLYG